MSETPTRRRLISLQIFQDSRVVPKAEYIDGEDSVGHYLTLNPDKASRFWMPDVFIDQAKALRVPTYYTQPASIRIYNDSTIRYSSRPGLYSQYNKWIIE